MSTPPKANGKKKPTILLIPGGWHTSLAFQPLLPYLHALGYATSSISLPSVDSPDPKSATALVDAAAIQTNGILPLLEGGQDVLLVMHSIGGAVGDMAAKGLSKRERVAEGLETGVVGLVFVATVFTEEGGSYWKAFGEQFAPGVGVDEEAGTYIDNDPIQRLYHEVPTALQTVAIRQLRSQSLASFRTPAGPLAHTDPAYRGMIGFLRTGEDYCIPTAFQDMHIARFEEEFGKGSLSVKRIEGGHSPFLSRPRELAGLLAQWAGEFEGVVY